MVSGLRRPVRWQSFALLSWWKYLLGRVERLDWLRLPSAESKRTAHEQRDSTHGNPSDQQGEPESDCGEQEPNRRDEEHGADQRIAHVEPKNPNVHDGLESLRLTAAFCRPSPCDPLVHLRHNRCHCDRADDAERLGHLCADIGRHPHAPVRNRPRRLEAELDGEQEREINEAGAGEVHHQPDRSVSGDEVLQPLLHN